MKKLFSVMLVVSMLTSMSLTAFAAGNSQTNTGGNSGIKVTGDVVEGTTGSVISADVSWENMTFNYTAGSQGVWQPDSHSYSGGTKGAWSDNKPAITVTNHSNAAIIAEFDFTSAVSGLVGTFYSKNGETYTALTADTQNAILSAATENSAQTAADSAVVCFGVSGGSIDKKTTLGTIYVNISKKAALTEAELEKFTTTTDSLGRVTITGVKDDYKGDTEIVIPDGVYSVECGALKDCTNLQKLTVPYVGNRSNGEYYSVGYVFGAKTFLQNEIIPSSLKEITVTGGYSNNETLKTNAFYNCYNLTNIVIGNGITNIEPSVFGDCVSLESITLPFIGDQKEGISAYRYYSLGYVFGTSTKFTDLMYNSGYYRYDSYRSQITYLSVYIPNSLKTITINGGEIFYRGFCKIKSVEKVVLGDGIEEIGCQAFYGCTNLEEIIIPSSVTIIDGYAFSDTKYEEKLNEMQDADGFIYINDILFKYNGTADTVYIKEGTRAIAGRAFRNNDNIETVICPSSLRYIGENSTEGAFFLCTNLKTVQLNEGLEYIGDRTFRRCTSLNFTDFPSTITFIGEAAFEGTAYLSNLSDGEHYIGQVFYKYSGEMPENTTITIREGTVGIAYGAFKSGDAGFDNLVEVIMPDSVTWIGDYAFYKATNLKNIKLSQNLTEIGKYAFRNCSSLSDITLPKSLKILNSYIFSGCNLDLTFEENSSLEAVLSYALSGLSSESIFYLPESVKYIGYRGFNTDATIVLPLINAEFEYGAYGGTVFFKGSKSDSYQLDDIGGNFYYYSEYEPDSYYNYYNEDESDSSSFGRYDNYWHYDENGKPVSWNDSAGGTPKYDVLGSTAAASSAEGAGNLFDGFIMSKWCVSFDSENGVYVIFSVGEAVVLNEYTFTTANDNAAYAGRNPKSWTIYGSNDANCADSSYDGWAEICSVTNDETMQDVNYTSYTFSIDGNTTAYQYYKIVFTANGGNDVLQLSEISLSYT